MTTCVHSSGGTLVRPYGIVTASPWLPCGRQLLRWTMPKRFCPTASYRLGPASTWQVGSLVLARLRPSVGSSTLENSERLVRAVIEMRLTAASTYDEHGQGARASELRSGAEILIAILS